MKISHILYVVCLSFQTVAVAAVECDLRDMVAETYDCLEGTFSVVIDFNHDQPDTAVFGLKLDGEALSYHTYGDLPVTLTDLPADGSIYYSFKVFDSLATDCYQYAEVGKLNCFACELGEPQVTYGDCEDGYFSATIDLPTAEVQETDSFYVKFDWEDVGVLTLADFPITIDSVKGKEYQEHHFKMWHIKRQDCSIEKELAAQNCEEVLKNISITPQDCQSDSTYSATIDFYHLNIDSVSLSINYELIGLFPTSMFPLELDSIRLSGNSTDDFAICATHDGDTCCISRKIITPCAENFCHLFDPAVTFLDCVDGSYFMEIDFDKVGAYSDSFGIDLEWMVYDSFAYADLPIQIGPFTGDRWSSHFMQIYDMANHGCCSQVEFKTQVCPALIELNEIVVGECREDGSFSVTVDFEGHGFLWWELKIDGQYHGWYSAEDERVTIDSFYADHERPNVKICAAGVEEYCIEESFAAPADCVVPECGFPSVLLEPSDCDSSGQFSLVLDFELPLNYSDSFVVEGPEDFRVVLAYTDLPIDLGSFQGGEEFYYFYLIDPAYPDFTAKIELGRVVCEEACNIAIHTEAILEQLEGSLYLLRIDSVTAPFGNADLTLGDEYLGFHKPKDFPLDVKIEAAPGDTLTITACVSDNTTCCTTIELVVPALECALGDLIADTTDCDGEQYFVNLDLDGADDLAEYYAIRDGDTLEDLFGKDLPVRLGPWKIDNAAHTFLLQSVSDPACIAEVELGPVKCGAARAPSDEQTLVLRFDGLDRYVQIPAMLAEPSFFQLSNADGMVIERKNISSESEFVVLRISRPPSGMYFVQLLSRTGERVTRKVIVP